LGSALLAAVLFAVVLLLDAYPLEPLPYRLGQRVAADIRARVPFRSKKTPEAARSAVPAVLTAMPDRQVRRMLRELDGLPAALGAAARPPAGPPPAAPPAEPLRAKFGLSTQAEIDALFQHLQGGAAEAYSRQVALLGQKLTRTAIIEPGQADELRKRAATQVVLQLPTGERTAAVKEVVAQDDSDAMRAAVTDLADGFAPPARTAVATYLLDALGRQPTYRYSDAATRHAVERAIHALNTRPADELPPYLCRIRAKGELLVVAGGEAAPGDAPGRGLSKPALELLRAEHEAYLAWERANRPWRMYGRLAGRVAILAAVIAALCSYVALYKPRIVSNHWRGFSLVAVILLFLVASKAMVAVLGCNPYATVLSVLMVAMAMTIVYGRRFGLAVGAFMSLLVALQIRADFDLLLAFLACAGATVLQLNEIRTRTKLIRTTAVSGAVLFVIVWSAGLAAGTGWPFVLEDSLWGTLAVMLCGFIAQGILPVIERIFGVATSMTLLEWCDASKPLLKRLAMDAPGTYNHSLQLGMMCEAAAETIGANGLLARVGAYYHDIGKVNKPAYFVENQTGGDSKHAKLNPAISLLIITGHVKDGLELAREFALPRALHEFISTHHGTTLLDYFYQAAAEQRKSNGTDAAPDEVEFRYPGPKPRMKECAILMLADAAESSVRAMAEPTPGRIESQVHTMVNRRLMDGQLDECELMLKEVHAIEASLTKSLCSIYHARIAYPTPPGEKPAAAEIHPRRPEPAAEKPEPVKKG
jgi:hypothetical protein